MCRSLINLSMYNFHCSTYVSLWMFRVSFSLLGRPWYCNVAEVLSSDQFTARTTNEPLFLISLHDLFEPSCRQIAFHYARNVENWWLEQFGVRPKPHCSRADICAAVKFSSIYLARLPKRKMYD